MEAARAEAARAEAARAQAAAAEAAKAEAAKAEDEKREAIRRAIGRQLDERAAQRRAEREGSNLPYSLSSARRYRLFGRSDPNPALVRYAEVWSRRLETPMNLETLRESLGQAHVDPTITVAVRSDGSVESVVFVRSSGVTALDEAIRRLVMSQAPYPVFPPALVVQYDVIEIRRTWHMDTSIRLY